MEELVIEHGTAYNVPACQDTKIIFLR